MIPTLAIAGGRDGRAKSTVAVNLAVGFSALGFSVELLDEDPVRRATGALRGAGPSGSMRPAEPADRATRTILEAGARLGVRIRDRIATDGGLPPADLRIVDTAPQPDERAAGALRGADLVIVALDAGAESRQALERVTQLLGDRSTSGLRIVVSRLLPRAVDRWRLVDDLDARFADALSPVTLPMGRVKRAPARAVELDATLYAPSGRAAKAYRAVAAEVASRLGLAPSGVRD